MKKLLVLILVLAACAPARTDCGLEWRRPMSVDMPGAGTVYVKWTAPAAVNGLSQKTVSIWIKHDDLTDDGTLFDLFGSGTNETFYLYFVAGSAQKIELAVSTSATAGTWRTTNNVVTDTGLWYMVTVTYNNGSLSNDPIFYINGASVAITETSTPTGTIDTGTSSDFYIGDPGATFNPNGRVADLRVYNTILSAADILALYNAGAFSPSYDTNLVFHAPLTNAKNLGGADFNGYTLTSSTTLVDRINCAVGTPSGSPLGSSSNP